MRLEACTMEGKPSDFHKFHLKKRQLICHSPLPGLKGGDVRNGDSELMGVSGQKEGQTPGKVSSLCLCVLPPTSRMRVP